MTLDDASGWTIQGVVDRIIERNRSICDFWSSSFGWAPLEAAELLNKSRLDWQVSLSHSLRLWIPIEVDAASEARLILGWSNLGSLVEGTLQLFLSVFYLDYQNDLAGIRQWGKLLDPDEAMLEQLRQFFRKRIWHDETWNGFVLGVQQRRNAIHAFRDRDIGTFADLHDAIRKYLQFLEDTDARLPYPGW